MHATEFGEEDETSAEKMLNIERVYTAVEKIYCFKPSILLWRVKKMQTGGWKQIVVPKFVKAQGHFAQHSILILLVSSIQKLKS